ncbi:MAG: histidine phosphatase family protein [Anaerolineaceae bacterium]
MKFIFVRHGESTANTKKVISNRDDIHGLTELGIQQADTLADRLAGEQVIGIYSSPLLRAHQTGRIIADKFNIPLIIAEELREFDCGSLEGRSDPDAWKAFLDIFQDWLQGKKWRVFMAGGESFSDIARRFFPFIEGLRKKFNGQEGSLVLISHGGLLYTMLPLILENVSYEYAGGTIIGNTGVVVAEELHGSLICREWCGKHIENC